MTTRDAYNLPEDLSEVSSALDRLARADGARDGLEERVFDASRASLPAPPTYRFRAREQVRPSWLSRFAPLPLAAAVALMGGLVVVWMAARPPVDSSSEIEMATLERSVDEWMELSSVFEDELAGDIDSLNSAASELDLDAWDTLLSDDEGSM